MAKEQEAERPERWLSATRCSDRVSPRRGVVAALRDVDLHGLRIGEGQGLVWGDVRLCGSTPDRE